MNDLILTARHALDWLVALPLPAQLGVGLGLLAVLYFAVTVLRILVAALLVTFRGL